MYCVGGSLKNLCHFEMGGGGVWQMLTSSGGGGSLNADRGEGGDKICQNLAHVICERSHRTITTRDPHWTESPLDGIPTGRNPTRISCISGYSEQWGFRASRNGILDIRCIPLITEYFQPSADARE